MSKFKEYLKLLPKGIGNFENIIEGWYNEIKLQNENLPEDEINEILRRRVICNQCPLNSVNAQSSKEYKDLYGKSYTTDRPDLHCSCCGCPIVAKTASLSSDCGLMDYNKEHKDKEQILKWRKYKN